MFNYAHIIANYAWAIKISLVLLAGLAATLVEYFLYKKYLPQARRKKYRWRRIVITALRGPFLWFVWLMVLGVTLVIAGNELGFNGDFLAAMALARRFLFLIVMLWFFMRLIKQWEQSFVEAVHKGEQTKFEDPTSINAIAQVTRVAAIIITVLMLMSASGKDMSALLAAGGIGGLALSFAAKDTLANFIGGLMVYWDRPFSVGDWISSPDRQIEGTVTNIGWRLTTIRTFDKRPLYVPNAVFSTVSVENPSRMLNRRIKSTIGIRYEDATRLNTISNEIREMLIKHPDIDTSQTFFVRMVEFGPSSLNLLIYAFTKTTDWVRFQDVQEDVFLKIIEVVASHGAQFAYPTSTVHVPEGIKPSTKHHEEVNDSRDLQ